MISADINPPSAPNPSVFIQTDVTQWTSLTKLFKSALTAHGRIDFVFANAGIGPRANYLALETDAEGELLQPATATLDVNLNSVINTATLAVHYMKTQKEGGSIVLMGSSTSLHPVRAIDYCTPLPSPPCPTNPVSTLLTCTSNSKGWRPGLRPRPRRPALRHKHTHSCQQPRAQLDRYPGPPRSRQPPQGRQLRRAVCGRCGARSRVSVCGREEAW